MTSVLRYLRGACLAAVLLTATRARAQAPVGYGDWQLHLPTNQARALADAGNRVYVAAENAFFYFDKSLNTTQLLSRRDGLNDVGVSTLAYDSVGQQLVVAYRSANLDILRATDGAILNLNDIARKEISGAKTINHIHVNARRAYLACSFGIVVVDLAKLEIRDSFTNIGPGGSVLRVYATAVANGTLFAATSNGLMRTSLSANPLDYRNWTTDLPARAGDPYRTLAVQAGRVVAGINGDRMVTYVAGSGWQTLGGAPAGVEYRQLTPSVAGLLITDNSKVTVLNVTNGVTALTLRPSQLVEPQAAVRAKGGQYYLADYVNGLLKTSNGQQAEQFLTNAPASAQGFSVLADGRSGKVNIFTGGYDEKYEQRDFYRGFAEYAEGRWTNITPLTQPNRAQYPNPKDLTRGVRTPDGTLYVGSYGNGLLEWKGPGEFRLFNPTTNLPNPLRSAIPDPNYTRVPDVATDAQGKIWVLNRHQIVGQSGVFVFDPVANSWQVLDYFSESQDLARLVLDDVGSLWAVRSKSANTSIGIVAYKPDSKEVRYFTVGNGLPSSFVNDIVKDRSGNIWVATDKGPAVFSEAASAFDTNLNLQFDVPYVRRGAGTGFPALFNERVRAVAVDGGNRKWFGTERGLWLFSADASEALQHFTTDNSPLPSNQIVDVEVNDKTGEVFVVTDAGTVAYRGDATVTEGKPSCAKVFPNPVRTDFAGQVGVTGLANNGFVKITDVTGKLVYQTRANGGAVTWNLQDYNGRRVQSGVYLVLSSDADGKNGCVSKVAVVEK
ncbi:type IX secretion system anionic LPS delivery protein PorZ [Hymenobacter metallilatus]|uniref:T9SS C-terminal target domain-containing protein n=1 Tax=Hymenobacter metallilatus TaxID=2493666 RepID=A0A428JI90_9BACT|nr:T9SS type A sorting domain-containing protein [Hymenobacter metallilatus]RSK32366.1 T9SS C-terminal target domain-containing protein [Hymenobacter metallilatus]